MYTTDQLKSLVSSIQGSIDTVSPEFMDILDKATGNPTEFQAIVHRYFGSTMYNLIYGEMNTNIGLYIVSNDPWLKLFSEWRLKNA